MHPSVSNARFSVASMFLVCGLAIATFVSRVPAIKNSLGLDERQLGQALLGTAIGAIVMFPTSANLISRYGSKPVVIGCGIALCFGLPGLSMAQNLPQLFVMMMLFGATFGGLDIAMNSQAVEVERLMGRHVMNGFHAQFSLAGVVGAPFGGWLADRGVHLTTHFWSVGLLLFLMVLLISRGFVSTAPIGRDGPFFAFPRGPLLVLGIAMALAGMAEGSVGDWAAVYFHETLRTSEGTAALVFGVFSVAMTIGRFSGDWLNNHFGWRALMIAGGLIAAFGYAFALLSGAPVLGLVGFAITGIGLSVVIPLGYAQAGKSTDAEPAVALAAVASMGYGSFLIAPPTLGFIAHATSLKLALLLVAGFCLMIPLLVTKIKR